MSGDNNKRTVAEFVERWQNQHDLAFADEVFHPQFVNHYRPEGLPTPETDRPASGFQAFYGGRLQGFPDATIEINEQLAERDLVATRKTFRGTAGRGGPRRAVSAAAISGRGRKTRASRSAPAGASPPASPSNTRPLHNDSDARAWIMVGPDEVPPRWDLALTAGQWHAVEHRPPVGNKRTHGSAEMRALANAYSCTA
jgi:SnoaL-like polyketide cyclase